MQISKEELLKRGWKVIGLVQGVMAEELLEKEGRRITWNAETKEVVEGNLNEEPQ